MSYRIVLWGRSCEVQSDSGDPSLIGVYRGFDHDPDNIAEGMLQCIHELGIPVALVGLLQAFAGTDLYDRLRQEGRLLGTSNGNKPHEFAVSFVPQRPAADLIADCKRILRALYPDTLDTDFDRCAILRDHWRPRSQGARPPRREDLKWAFRYLKTSLAQPDRWNSFRFLLGTLRKKRFFCCCGQPCNPGAPLSGDYTPGFEHGLSHGRDGRGPSPLMNR